MAAQPIVLPSKTFSTKGEAEKFFSEMLGRYKDGDRVSSADEIILYEYFLRNPDAKMKTGPGVDHFFKDKSPNHNTSCFHVSWVGGEGSTDFGLRACKDGVTPTLEALFYSACRYAVDASLKAEKKEIFDKAGGVVCCSKTGVPTTFTTSYYRHTQPRFKEIVAGFVALKSLSLTESMLTSSQNDQYVTRFSEPAMEIEFILYHDSVSNLAIFAS